MDAMVDYSHADSLARGVLTAAVTRTAATLDTRGAGQAFAVFNPSAVARTDVVRLPRSDGGEDTVQVTVPATGIRIVHAAGDTPVRARAVALPSRSFTLDSRELRVEIDSTSGAIAHLYDKRTHRDVVAPGANSLVMLVDRPSGDDAWNIDNLNGARTWLTHDRVVSPVRHVGGAQVIEVHSAADSVRVVQRYVLRDGVPRLDIETMVDWHQAHQLLKAMIPLGFRTDSSHAEIPYGVIARPTIPVSKYDSARFETPMQRFVDADAIDRSVGIALITDSKYGYSAHGDTLSLSLLRSPKAPDSTADMGVHHFMYSIVPHVGDWRAGAVRDAATSLNDPLVVVPVPAHAGTTTVARGTVSLAGTGVEMTALKRTEDGDAVIIRLVETTGRAADATLTLAGALRGTRTVTDGDLLERPVGPSRPITGASVVVHLTPWEIHTLIVR